MGTTYDVEFDVLTKLAELLPSDIELVDGGVSAPKTAWNGPPRPVGVGEMPINAVFVQVYGGTRDIHNDGALRFYEVQVVTRHARNNYEEALELANRIHDALDLIGRWTANGRTYVDLRSMSAGPIYVGPGENDEEFFAETFEVWFDG